MNSRIAATLMVCLIVATACQSQDTTGITSEKIETCWKAAGIQGDLYRFMTPREAAGLRPDGVVSAEQSEQFGKCVRA